jgi:phage terminase large subunit GpA-like protein
MPTESNLRLQDQIPASVISTWLPPEEFLIPDWVEKNVQLTKQSSSRPGLLRIQITPYTRGMLLAWGNYFVEHIIACWGRQLGKTEGVQIPLLCYVIAVDPGPTTFLLPTEDKCRSVAAQKIDPMFEVCKAVQDQRTPNQDDYMILQKKFRGMTFFMVWAGSGSQATTRSTRYLFRDEIDEFKSEVGIDASNPLKAIQQTTTGFPDRKILDTSTPTVKHGNIWRGLRSCKYVFEFWIACPHCDAKQILYWGTKESAGGVKWDGEEDPVAAESRAYYRCEACEGKITNQDKNRILAFGEWRARLTPDPCEQIISDIPPNIDETISLDEVLERRLAKKIGSHLPKWYGSMDGHSFGEAAKDFLEATQALENGEGYTLMRDWKKFWKAVPWEEEKIPETEIELLKNKVDMPAMVCPPDTLFLTCGIDPSEGMKWFVVKAWVRNKEHRGFTGHLVHYGTLGGFDDLERFLRDTRYPVLGNPDIQKPILASGYDTGGGKDPDEERDITMTVAAYHWLKKAGRMRMFVVGTKGASHPLKNLMAKQAKIEKEPGKNGKPIPGGLRIWEIDTDQLKRNLWFHLRIGAEEIIDPETGEIIAASNVPGRFTFHADTDLDYIKHLLSEKLIRDKKGKEEWKRKGKNHWLDATIIADALVENDCYGLQLTYLGRRQGGQSKSDKEIEGAPKINPATQKPRGSWVKGWER